MLRLILKDLMWSKLILFVTVQYWWQFTCRKRYTDPINQAVVKKVISETRSLDPTVCAFNVKGKVCYKEWRCTSIDAIFICLDAIRRFFQSKLEEKSLKDKGAYVAKVQKQRRRNRLVKVSYAYPLVELSLMVLNLCVAQVCFIWGIFLCAAQVCFIWRVLVCTLPSACCGLIYV